MGELVRGQADEEAAELWRRWLQRRPWRIRRRHLPWLGLLALAAALRLAGITATSVWHDEAMTIHTARMGVYEQVVRMSVANNQPPLIFLLFKLWALVSWAPLWLRLLPLAISLLGVVYAVRWLRLWDARSGWIAGLLVATSPMMIHYAQEIRAYALLYACTLAGLYYGELVARTDPRRARVGLLVCACALSYAHYVGSLIAVALWVYTWIRGTGPWRTAVLAAAWGALAGPILALGLFHASDKMETGFWVDPVTAPRMFELATAWTAHRDLGIWQTAGGGINRSWIALGLSALLTTGIGLALIASPTGRHRGRPAVAGAMLAAGLTFVVLVVVVSVAAVPIALERTTFPAFIPLMGVMALSTARAVPGWTRAVGLTSCLAVACVWTFTWVVRVYLPPERRPDEQGLFGPIAARLQPGEVVIVFSPQLQASAGYFLGQVAEARQIHSSELARLADTPDGLRLRPVPRRPNQTWFAEFRQAVDELQRDHPHRHGVWLVDMGPRSTGDVQSEQVRDWLDGRYILAESFTCGTRWTHAARRFVPQNSSPTDGPTDTTTGE